MKPLALLLVAAAAHAQGLIREEQTITVNVHPFLQLSNITNTVYQEIAGVAMPRRAILGGIEIRLKNR